MSVRGAVVSLLVATLAVASAGVAWAQDAPEPAPQPEPEPPPPEEPENRIVTGLVEHATTGAVLAGATVSVVGTDLRVTTDADGFFILVNVPATNVELRVETAGFEPRVLIAPAGQGSVRIQLVPRDAQPPPEDRPATRAIAGRVTEQSTGEPIPGATVLVRGTDLAAITDEDGNYVIDGVPADDVELEVSDLAHETRTVVVPAGSNTGDAQLPLAEGEQIVIVGRAPQIIRQNLANGASVVESEDLGRVSAGTLDDALFGKVAGANLQRNSGAPGGGVQLRLRGVSTINGQSSPLYVVDGVIISNVSIPSGISVVTASGRGSNASSTQDNQVNRVADLDINDIETVEVLKGPSAAALYGSKAANGVVIITTKRGKGGKVRASVTQRFGFSQISNKLGSREFESEAEAVEAFGPTAADHWSPTVYDHEGQIFGNTDLARETVASLSGGAKTTSYFASLLLRDEPGVLLGTGYSKQSGRLGVTQRFGNRFTLGLSSNLLHTDTSRGMTQNDNAGVSHYMVLPFTPNFLDLRELPDGTYPRNPFIGSGTNPLQTVSLMSDSEEVWRFIGAVNGDLRLLTEGEHELRLTGVFGVDWFQQQNDLLFPPELFFEPADQLAGTSLDTNAENLNTNAALNLVYAYTPHAGTWRSVTTGGLLYEQRALDVLYIVSQSLTAGQTNVDAGTQIGVTENRLKIKDRGGFVQEELVLFGDTLSLLLGMLAERSSVNGDTAKLFVYPKTAALYNLSEPTPFVDLVRFRVAYGEAGNQPLYGRKFTPLLASDNIEGNAGIGVAGIAGDPGLEPERQREIDLGVDFVGWNGRIVAEVSLYQRSISNMLLQRASAPSTGFTQEVFNGGSLRNRGVEAMLQIEPVQTRDFRWLSRTTFTLNRSKITDLPIPAFLTGGFGTGLGAFRIEEGASATQIVGNHGLLPDGTCCVIEKLGDAEPTFRMSFANNFQWNQLGLTTLWDWQQGSEVINLTKFLYDLGQNTADYEANGATRLMDQATDAGVYIEDATFLKLREVSLYYEVPGSFVTHLAPANKLLVSVSGRNLLTFTRYSGLDPEVSNFGNQPIARNIDVAPYAPVRSYWFSVTATF